MKLNRSMYAKLLLLCLLYVCVGSSTGAADNDSTLTLQNVNLVDVVNGTVKPQMAIVIKNGKIAKIGNTQSVKPLGKIMDMQNAYVIPGLIDVHAHVTAMFKPNEETTYKHLNYFLRHGITTVRDAAGNAPVLQKMHKEVNEGKIQAADVYYSAFMAGRWYYDRGVGARREPYTAWEQCVNPGDDLDKAMQAAKDCGATGLKLYHSFDKDFLVQIVKAAKKHGLKIWGHAMMYPAKPHEVAAAGVEVISHIYMVESYSTDTLIRLRKTPQRYKDSIKLAVNINEFCRAMKQNNAILDATICVSYPREKWVLPMLKRMHNKGVKVAAGTDQIVDLAAPYPRLMDELTYYADSCGFTNAEALRTATTNAAETIGMEKQIGTITVGKRADLVVLEANPLISLKNLRQQVLVIQLGRIVQKE
ncbi:amidohydrolase family protein [Mucilaginibacter terrae]|uniref:Imidazolonepropionase-like amidohydrolase n=1 Tax=Mucilaginibacter terrae TaxID=1955052 RepID=A0ABU3H0D9_9SPHI|nr:amidohydrolase family protein [Mucilaginibacter terrae]MDT3405341.1 imidazolonepropionase-like amidohydrolase [Mucilaginibacter terrae]